MCALCYLLDVVHFMCLELCIVYVVLLCYVLVMCVCVCRLDYAGCVVQTVHVCRLCGRLYKVFG